MAKVKLKQVLSSLSYASSSNQLSLSGSSEPAFSISGSLIVTGSASSFNGLNVTGSLNVSGTANLTASWAQNVQASGVIGLNLSQISSGSVSASVNVNSASFQITSGSSTLLFVSNSGRVNIGTTSSTAALTIGGGSLVVGSGYGYGTTYGSASDGILQITDANAALLAGGNYPTQIVLRQAGNVASQNSNYWGTIEQSAGGMLINSGKYLALYLRAGGVGSTQDTYFQQSNAVTSMTIKGSTANILIGTTTDSGYKLLTTGSGASGSLNVNNILYVSGSNVGIGTNTPQAQFNINQIAGGIKGLFISGDEVYASGNGATNKGIRIALGVSRGSNRQLWMGDNDAFGSSTLSLFRYQTGVAGYAGIDTVTGDGITRLLTIIGTDTSNVGIGYDSTSPNNTNYTAKLNVFTYNSPTSSLLLKKYGTSTGNFLELVNTSGSQLVTIPNTGNLLLATTADSGFKLDVSGSTRITNNLTVTGSTQLTGSLVVVGSISATSSISAYSAGAGTITLTGNAGSGNPGIQSSGIIHISAPINGTGGSEILAIRKSSGGANIVNFQAYDGTILSTITGNGSLALNKSSANAILDVSGSALFSGNITATSGSSYFTVTHSLTQPAQTGSQISEVYIAPTFTYTAPNQTQTALRVLATYTGSSALSSSQANIIADIGATSVGSQFIVNDITSGSIYLVNDVSGLPIIEANSNWDVFMYDYPNTVFKKTGSVVELGIQNNTSSYTQFKSDLVINEGLGFTYRQAQASGSTNGAVTASLYNITFTTVSSSVYMHAVVTGYDTGSREVITGDVKATVKYAAGAASVVGYNQSFLNSDNSVVSFDVIAGGTSGSLVAYGTGSRVYQWGATVTTQVI